MLEKSKRAAVGNDKRHAVIRCRTAVFYENAALFALAVLALKHIARRKLRAAAGYPLAVYTCADNIAAEIRAKSLAAERHHHYSALTAHDIIRCAANDLDRHDERPF